LQNSLLHLGALLAKPNPYHNDSWKLFQPLAASPPSRSRTLLTANANGHPTGVAPQKAILKNK